MLATIQSRSPLCAVHYIFFTCLWKSWFPRLLFKRYRNLEIVIEIFIGIQGLADIHYVHLYSSLKRFISFSSVTRWVQLVLPGSTELRGHQELQLSLRLQLQPDLLVSHLPRCSAKQLKDNLLHVLSFFAWNLFTVLFVRLLVDWNSESVEVLWYWSLAVWSRGPEESAFEHLEQQLML